MPRGDKASYSAKQKRMAGHIIEGYLDKGMPEERAEAIGWATVNKQDGGAKGKGRSARDRSEAARKGWETRRSRQKSRH